MKKEFNSNILIYKKKYIIINIWKNHNFSKNYFKNRILIFIYIFRHCKFFIRIICENEIYKYEKHHIINIISYTIL